MVGSGTGSRMINIVIAKLVTLNSKRILSRLRADRRWRRQYAREVLTTRITIVKERESRFSVAGPEKRLSGLDIIRVPGGSRFGNH